MKDLKVDPHHIFKQFLFSQQQQIVQLMFPPLMIVGLMVIFLGVYRFPIFLEFNWKENLIKLFIIDRKNLKQVYSYNFVEHIYEKNNSIDNLIKPREMDLFFSRGIIGINDIISSITTTEDEKIEKIKQGEFVILLKSGDEPLSFITFCLLIKKEMISINYFLKTMKNQFQNFYKNILLNLDLIEGKERKIFSKFDVIIKNILK